MDKKVVNDIFNRFSQVNPEPKTELIYSNHFTLLVAVVLSAQTTDIQVNKATESLFKVADTPEKMYALGEEKLKEYIKTIGLFNAKAKNVIALSKMLIEEYNSEVPEKIEELAKLPGVGRKTANVILNCAFNIPTIAVDTHVFRVSNRIGLVKAKTPLETELQLLKAIPEKWQTHAHHWLILHGRYTCKAKKPDCENCIIKDLCEFYSKI
jgi:endonuclease-3